MTTPTTALSTVAFPVFSADVQPAAATGLTLGGWLTMLFCVTFVTVFFVWCLSRVLRAK